MAQGDLDIGLLLKIMKSVGESRDRGDPMFTISTGHLMDLVPAQVGSGEAAPEPLGQTRRLPSRGGLTRYQSGGHLSMASPHG
jgi:hypothetical protein